jgi:hypothetical protein
MKYYAKLLFWYFARVYKWAWQEELPQISTIVLVGYLVLLATITLIGFHAKPKEDGTQFAGFFTNYWFLFKWSTGIIAAILASILASIFGIDFIHNTLMNVEKPELPLPKPVDVEKEGALTLAEHKKMGNLTIND